MFFVSTECTCTHVHTQVILHTSFVAIHVECVPVAPIVISSPVHVATSSQPVSLSLHLQSLDVIGMPAGQSVSCCVLLFIHTHMLWSQMNIKKSYLFCQTAPSVDG